MAIQQVIDALTVISQEIMDSCPEIKMPAEGSAEEDELIEKLSTFFKQLVEEYSNPQGPPSNSNHRRAP